MLVCLERADPNRLSNRGGGKVKTPSVPVPECDQIGLPRATAKVLAVVTLVITIITAGLKTLVSHATDEQIGPIKM